MVSSLFSQLFRQWNAASVNTGIYDMSEVKWKVGVTCARCAMWVSYVLPVVPYASGEQETGAINYMH